MNMIYIAAGFEMDMKLPLSKYSEKLKSPTDPLFVSSEATFCNAVSECECEYASQCLPFGVRECECEYSILLARHNVANGIISDVNTIL